MMASVMVVRKKIENKQNSKIYSKGANDRIECMGLLKKIADVARKSKKQAVISLGTRGPDST